MTRKVLIVLAHPAFHKSRANRALIEAASAMEGVSVRDLYELYPDFLVDVRAEQAALEAHQALVLQHPLHLFSCPALGKEWLDVVLSHGWAYGEGERALVGMNWMQAVTSGLREGWAAEKGLERYELRELLRPFEATALLCGMQWREPFMLHARQAQSASDVAHAAEAYCARIRELQDG